MASKKKLLTSAIALGTAAALTLGGTFAWQSISQKALNEASDQINPGGRLHNDMNFVDPKTTDVNIYVENFDQDNIYARVRLSEYMEIVMNYNTPAEVVEVVTGSKTLKDSVRAEDGNTLTDESATRQNKFDYKYTVHDFAKDQEGVETPNPTSKYFTWQHADKDTAEADLPYFMPTFNKNKDSLMADINGMYRLRVGGISAWEDSEHYSDGYTLYTKDSEAQAWAIYDGDYNNVDELKDLDAAQLNDIIFDPETGGKNSEYWKADYEKAVVLKEETHQAAQVGTTRGLIAMSDWLDLTEDTDRYWVYDDSEGGDGWVYWSSPIKGGETTGLLLDGYTLKGVMDDTWYYAIDVQAQFITANDIGEKGTTVEDGNVTGGTGFYADGETVTENAEKLLKSIGVEFGDAADDSGATNGTTLSLTVETTPDWFLGNEDTEISLKATSAKLVDTSNGWSETEIPDSELENITWSLKDNHSANTKFSTTRGSSTTLTVSSEETASFYVVASLTYEGASYSSEEYISYGPSVAGMAVCHKDGNALYQTDYYEPGKDNEYEVVFFSKRTSSSVRDYDRKYAYTGEAQKYLAKDVKWALGEIVNDGSGPTFVEKEITGVTLKQSDTDPAQMTLTVADNATSDFAIAYEEKGTDGAFSPTSYNILTPKLSNIYLHWPELEWPEDAEVDRVDGRKLRVTLAGASSVTPIGTPISSNLYYDHEQNIVCNFYADEPTIDTEGYKAYRYGNSGWIICDEDCDAQYGINVPEDEIVAKISDGTGKIEVKQELGMEDEAISFHYTVTAACNGFEVEGTIYVTAKTGWALRLMSSDEYDLLEQFTGEENSKMHGNGIYTWTSDLKSSSQATLRTTYDDGLGRSFEFATSNADEYSGLRPAFRVPPTYDCDSLTPGDVVTMGTLYVGDTPVKVPNNPVAEDGDITAYDPDKSGITTAITLREALPDEDYQMKAIYLGDRVFVCDRVMLNYISWEQINSTLELGITYDPYAY